MRMAIGSIVLFVHIFCCLPIQADDGQVEFFEKKIRPILATHCYECHSAGSKKLGGSLYLDSREGVRKGGESGEIVQLGDPDNSLLIKAVRFNDDNVKMPPKGKLPDSVIADLETWVKNGAVDPRDEASPTKKVSSWSEVLEERSNWWSLKPVANPVVPTLDGAAKPSHPVDRFIQAKLTESGLTSAAPTNPRTLIRRLCLVLTGLPPTVAQVDKFLADCQSGTVSQPGAIPTAAVERLVDELLQSPHFGEQWARHWMDVVRFSETHGNEWNYEVHHAWRFRDYLIRAFNNDVPYNQFVKEHLAGDLLANPRWNKSEKFNESVIGTGFYRFGEVNHDDCITLRSIGYDLADNQIDTLTKAFQATTVACARCHQHKLDAVSAEDYYALLGVIRSSRNVSHCIDALDVNESEKERMREVKAALRRELAGIWQSDVSLLGRYMAAATAAKTKQANAAELASGLVAERLEKWVAALSADKLPLEDPLNLWRQLVAAEIPAAFDGPADALNTAQSRRQIWESWAEQVSKELKERADFNWTEFETFVDFRKDGFGNWLPGGQSMTDPVSADGEFVVQPDGETIVQSILPAGRYTHVLSSKLNGTLRSQVLPLGKKHISFHVVGQRSSAVRLVSNNCQLNYANYRALVSPDFHWITFSPPEDRDVLRTYAELMTMFDNPKFPDQLSPLGGDKENYKMPWEKAAENPRSYFGVTHVVLHDGPTPPKTELTHLQSLIGDGTTLPTTEELIDRYVTRISAAITDWAEDRTTDDDVRWLDVLVRRNLISNAINRTPRCESLVKQYRQIDAGLSLPRVIVGFGDGGPGIEQPVFTAGDCMRPGKTVPRRFLEVIALVESPHARSAGQDITSFAKPFTSCGSGRLELAEQIADPVNPLTARVMVNRIWHHLFGAGLVRTVDDFGHIGDTPSHPELLDFLAYQFMQDGWSVKRMIRSLVLTDTFQQSNRTATPGRTSEPLNRLLHHYSARRLEAEAVRDSILTVSGRLDETLYGPSIQPYREKEYADRRLFPGPLDGNGRRSVYIKNNLMEGAKFLETFNMPGGKVTQGRRDVTNVPAQALALLNDPFVIQQAEYWATRLISHSNETIPSRLNRMFQSALSRNASTQETARFETSIRQLADLYKVGDTEIMTNPVIWKDVAHAVFNMSEFLYIP